MTVIGLTTYAESARMLVWDREFALLHASHHDATERGGGYAVLRPPQAAGADEVLDRIDGRLFAALVDAGQRYRERRKEGMS